MVLLIYDAAPKINLLFQRLRMHCWISVHDYIFCRACLSYGPHQAYLVLIAYVSSEGSGEPAHPRSLARSSAARSYKQ